VLEEQVWRQYSGEAEYNTKLRQLCKHLIESK
jgi:hypothetical protein